MGSSLRGVMDDGDPFPTGSNSERAGDTPQDRCDHCQLVIPREPVAVEHRGVTYHFCSETCRDALESRESVFTAYRGYKQMYPGVAAMDASLPQGVPRNSFVLLSGQSGTRDQALQAELVWRTLQKGEPAVVVSFLETPTSVIQSFASFDWNVLPYLESGHLQILDCFTYRLDDADRIYQHMNAWNRHLHDAAQTATTSVRDATDVTNVANRLDRSLEAADMNDDGIVVIDSLTELGSLVQPVRAYDFLKGVRAEVCKGRFVPVFAGGTVMSDERGFPHDLGYMVDGIVDLRLTDELVERTLLKQLRVRKMNGVLTIPEWYTYEYTSEDGMIVFDPEEEIRKAELEQDDHDGKGSEYRSEGTENPDEKSPTGDSG